MNIVISFHMALS